MSVFRARLFVMTGMFVGACALSGCGGTATEPVEIEAAATPAVDAAAAQKAKEDAMENYDPRTGSPAGSGPATGSPPTI
ncbi:MAG: hypothetical protein KDB00_29620 [Planctomycetales bacterium]|nr:hypothetical protein [Planctomycetales bacterium]